MKKYTYPDPRTVTEASALVAVRLEIDFENERAQLLYRELGADGQTVSSPSVTFDDLSKLDAFAAAATDLPGLTFGEKLLAPTVLRNLLNFVPAGGTVEDV